MYCSVKEAVKNGAIKEEETIFGTGVVIAFVYPADNRQLYIKYNIDWHNDNNWLRKVNSRFERYKRKYNIVSNVIIEVFLWD